MGQDKDIIVLSNRDRDLFLEMLENPPEPNQALKDAFRKSQAGLTAPAFLNKYVWGPPDTGLEGTVTNVRKTPGVANQWEIELDNSGEWHFAAFFLPYNPDPNLVSERPINKTMIGSIEEDATQMAQDMESGALEMPHNLYKRLEEAHVLELLYNLLSPEKQAKIAKRLEKLNLQEIMSYFYLFIEEEYMRSGRFGEVVQALKNAYDRDPVVQMPAISLALNAVHTRGKIIEDYVGLDAKQLSDLSNIDATTVEKYANPLGIFVKKTAKAAVAIKTVYFKDSKLVRGYDVLVDDKAAGHIFQAKDGLWHVVEGTATSGTILHKAKSLKEAKSQAEAIFVKRIPLK